VSIRIRALDAADKRDVEASYRIQTAAQERDIPDFPPFSWADHVGHLAYPWPGQLPFNWLAELGDAPVGVLTVELPQLDNLHMAHMDLTVHPEYRRRGVGRALHSEAVAFARSQGRRRMNGQYVTQLPGGAPREDAPAAFADAVGAKIALPEVRRRLDLDTVDTAAWADLLADAWTHAGGYSVVRWVGAAPEQYVADVAALDGRLLLDAPMGELDLEPEKVDVARIRGNEETARNRGRRLYHVGVRHDASDRLVAWTTIAFLADTTSHAWQLITIVDPAHRGHRLGLIAKIDNLEHTLAHEPGLRDVNTWNAAENTHMIAINETIGFRAVDGWVGWQQEI
jgi:GNAT superfamily N-acetyltransferase/RimJ/RimL family protein N-acetyltransferase